MIAKDNKVNVTMFSTANMNAKFSEWLQEELDKRGWSQSELSKRAGVARATISNVLSGMRQPGPELCGAIARAFDVPQTVVFQAAGLMDPGPEFDPEVERLNHLYSQLTPEDQEEIRSIVEMKLRIKEREAAKRRKKHTGPLTEP